MMPGITLAPNDRDVRHDDPPGQDGIRHMPALHPLADQLGCHARALSCLGNRHQLGAGDGGPVGRG